MLNQRGIAHILFIFILLAGIIAGVYLSQKTQIFKPKAYDLPLITLTDYSGIPLPNKITDPNVHILIKLPDNWELPPEEGSLLQNIVKSVNAQEFGGGSDLVTANPICAPPHDYYADHMDVKIIQNIPNQGNNDSIWTTITDETSGFSGIISQGGTGQSIYTIHDSFQSIRDRLKGSKSAIVNLVPDGTKYTVKVYSAPYTEDYPDLTNLLAETSFSTVCPKTTPPPIASGPAQPVKPVQEKRTLKKLTIKNSFISEDQTSNGNETLEITSDFKNYLNRVIPWKLHSLPEGEKENFRTVMVALSDGTEFGEYFWGASIILISPDKSLNPQDEILVDVYIDQDYPDLIKTESWIKDALDNFVNEKLNTYEVKRKVKFNSATIKDVGEECKEARTTSTYNLKDNRIRVVMSKSYSYSYATSQDWLCFSSYNNDETDKNILLHELGHIFGLPDYYMQDVYTNYVVPRIFIISEIDDVMRHNKPYFSATSREIINRLSTPIPGHSEFWKYYTPKQLILQIMDNSNLPVPGAKVEVFPSVMESISGSVYPRLTIPNLASFERITDNTGRVFLGDQEYIFHHHTYVYPTYKFFAGGSALIRITNGNEVRYATLTLAHLNNLFFEKGLTNFATITTAFSQLIKAPQYGNIIIKEFNKLSSEEPPSKEEREELDQHLYQQLRVSQGISSE